MDKLDTAFEALAQSREVTSKLNQLIADCSGPWSREAYIESERLRNQTRANNMAILADNALDLLCECADRIWSRQGDLLYHSFCPRDERLADFLVKEGRAEHAGPGSVRLKPYAVLIK